MKIKKDYRQSTISEIRNSIGDTSLLSIEEHAEKIRSIVEDNFPYDNFKVDLRDMTKSTFGLEVEVKNSLIDDSPVIDRVRMFLDGFLKGWCGVVFDEPYQDVLKTKTKVIYPKCYCEHSESAVGVVIDTKSAKIDRIKITLPDTEFYDFFKSVNDEFEKKFGKRFSVEVLY